MKPSQHILIGGAGPVGSLAALYLHRLGHKATLLDKRRRPGTLGFEQSRSINLALSHRGWRALEEVGLADQVRQIALPMRGRIVHDVAGHTGLQPYGTAGECIYSVSRGALNQMLHDEVAKADGLTLHYQSRITGVDMVAGTLKVSEAGAPPIELGADAVLASDGAFSAVRYAFQVSDRFDFEQSYIAHAYQEFHMPALPGGGWAMDPEGLHIWPRGSFMMIALPNPDGTFTCTLFLAWEGAESFATLQDPAACRAFFERHFADFIALVPNYLVQAQANVVSSLVTMRCAPWNKGRMLLIGDAAHAIVPFYGQGMNAGFEDVRLLMEALPEAESWESLFADFAHQRKPDADAIAELALSNFVEMRDSVADPAFLLGKQVERRLAALLPTQWVPIYPMISFTSIPYAEAQARGAYQAELVRGILARDGGQGRWQNDAWLLQTLAEVDAVHTYHTASIPPIYTT